MNPEFKQISEELRKPLPAEAHQERDLPGGGKWFYLPWQAIRDRLTEICPDWQIAYDEPHYLDKYCIVKGRLTICGVSREAWGNAEIELLSKSGKDMSRGNAIERAITDCFKNCCESFSLGAYLDEQSKDKREFTLRYLHSKGDGRAKKFAIENGYLENSTARSLPSKPAAKPSTPSEAPEPKTQKKPSNENSQRIKEVCELLGMKGKLTAEAYKAAAPVQGLNKPSEELTSAECSRVIDEILAQWGLRQKCFKAINHARSAFALLMESPEISDDMVAIVASWKADCDRRLAEKSQEVPAATW